MGSFLFSILSPLFEEEGGDVDGNVSSNVHNYFFVWLPGISPVGHTGVPSIDILFSQGLGGKKAEVLRVFIHFQQDCRGMENKESSRGRRKGLKSPTVQI